MQNLTNQILDTKLSRIMLFIGLFTVAFLIFSPFLKTHYGIDTYQHKIGTMSSNIYDQGRFLTGIVWYLFVVIGIDPLVYQPFFTFLSICLLSLAAYLLICLFSSLRMEWNVESFLILCISIMASLYQAFIVGWFIYPEGIFFFMSALVLSVSAVISISQESWWKGGILSYVFMSSALAFYQGAGPFFVVFAMLYAVIKKALKPGTRFFKRFSTVLIIYFLAGITNVFLIKVRGKVYGRTSFGEVNLWERVFEIIGSLQKKLQDTHLGAAPFYAFLGVMIIFFLIVVVILKKNGRLNKQSILLLITFYISSFFSIMAPHFLTHEVDISPRSIAALMSLPGATCMFIFMQVNTFRKSILNYMVPVLLLLFLLLNANIVHSVATSRVATNLLDKELARIIYGRIISYEKDTGNTVTNIATRHDENPTLCYQGLTCYGSFRAMNYDKVVIPLMTIVSGRNFTRADMPDSIYNSYFKEKDFDIFNEKQIIFQGNTLYLLLY